MPTAWNGPLRPLRDMGTSTFLRWSTADLMNMRLHWWKRTSCRRRAFCRMKTVSLIRIAVRTDMSDSSYSPWLHRLAVLTACMALFTIAVGTTVTTKKAGMAFPDWPTSDGYGMFSYPWWQSAGDKFLEHGHRLAGIVIGIASLVLCAALVWKERRRWVKLLGAVVLLTVIMQGILGGFRVRLNAEDLALVHGSGAAMVFALTVGVAVVTSSRWGEPLCVGAVASLARLQLLSIATTLCVF